MRVAQDKRRTQKIVIPANQNQVAKNQIEQKR